MSTVYGPSNPPIKQDYSVNRKRSYIGGYVDKIRYDLARLLSIYIGLRAVIYTLDQGPRCTNCTDSMTGAKILSSCNVCMGTGYLNKYNKLLETWIGINIGPAQNIALETGATQNSGSKRDLISIVYAPQLHDRDIIILKDSKLIYKIEDIEPDIVGLAGNIVLQNVQASLLEPGHITYNLIDW